MNPYNLESTECTVNDFFIVVVFYYIYILNDIPTEQPDCQILKVGPNHEIKTEPYIRKEGQPVL